MEPIRGFYLAMILTAPSLLAQFHPSGNLQPRTVGTFGSVVFPGGQPVQPGFGSVVFPGGGGPRLIVPGSITDPGFGLRLGATVSGLGMPGIVNRSPVVIRPPVRSRIAPIITYPIFVGGYYDGYPYGYPQEPQQPPQQNITIVYPPQQPSTVAVPYSGGEVVSAPSRADEQSNLRSYRAPSNEPATQSAPAQEPDTYFLAFKDHTVYPAVAYYVEGETLHYFTAGNRHNQVSLSLVDREMTERLNKPAGVTVNLPK